MLTRTLADVYSGTQSPALSAAQLTAARLGIPLTSSNQVADPTLLNGTRTLSDTRIATVDPALAARAADTAAKMGITVPIQQPQQVPTVPSPTAPAQSPAATAAIQQTQQQYADQQQQLADAIKRLTSQNAPPTQPMAGNPNQQQLTPQAMAMIDMMRQRAAMTDAQRMVADRGVFGGQQQAAAMPAMPPMNLPALYAGGR